MVYKKDFYTILRYINNYSESLYYAQTKKYMWLSAGNLSESAYVLYMMYFLFIFLHKLLECVPDYVPDIRGGKGGRKIDR